MAGSTWPTRRAPAMATRTAFPAGRAYRRGDEASRPGLSGPVSGPVPPTHQRRRDGRAPGLAEVLISLLRSEGEPSAGTGPTERSLAFQEDTMKVARLFMF